MATRIAIFASFLSFWPQTANCEKRSNPVAFHFWCREKCPHAPFGMLHDPQNEEWCKYSHEKSCRENHKRKVLFVDAGVRGEAVFSKNRGKCFFCSKDLDFSARKGESAWEIEHIVPRSRGGADAFFNFIPACHNCNHTKGAKGLGEFCQGRSCDGPIREGLLGSMESGPNALQVTNAEQFQMLLQMSGLVILFFYTKWCGPSRDMHSHFIEASKMYRTHSIVFALLDIEHHLLLRNDQHTKSINELGLQIDALLYSNSSQEKEKKKKKVWALPTIVFLRNGRVEKVVEGPNVRLFLKFLSQMQF